MHDDKIKIVFSKYPFCFRTIKLSEFTNKLKNEGEFFEKFKIIIEQLIPHISQYTFSNIQGQTPHCHPVNDDKRQLVYEIVGELVKNWNSGYNVEQFLQQNLDGEVIWELGLKDVRLFGIRESNFFHLLFVDYHHLVYPSVKYNDKNYSRNKFGVIE